MLFAVFFLAKIYACLAGNFWHDKSNCQQVCLEMTNHKPFTKSVTFTNCLNGKTDKRSSSGKEKLFCIQEVKRDTVYYISNVASKCGNGDISKPIKSRAEVLNKCKKIWAQCAGECSTDCYHDAVLDHTPKIDPRVWSHKETCD